MELSEFLRDDSDEWQFHGAASLVEPLSSLALALINRSKVAGQYERSAMLRDFRALTDDQRRLLLQAIAPQLTDELLCGCYLFAQRPIGEFALFRAPLDDSLIKWLQEILCLVGRFRREAASARWLAVWGGTLKPTEIGSGLNTLLKQMGVTGYYADPGDHVGRLLGAVLWTATHAKSQVGLDTAVADDIYDTLSLIARNQHPLGRFGPHVARALAHSCRPDATALLIDVIRSVSTDGDEDTTLAEIRSQQVSTCLAAAIEGLKDHPEQLADVLTAVLQVGRETGDIPWDLINAALVPLPPDNETRYAMVESAVSHLRDASLRQMAIEGDDPMELLVGLSVEAVINPRSVFQVAVEQLSDNRSWESKTVIAVLAARWDCTQAIPLWQRLIEICIDPLTPELMLEHVLSMRVAAQVKSNDLPDGTAFESLVRLGERITDAWKPIADLKMTDKPRYQIASRLGEAIIIHRREQSANRLVSILELLTHCPQKFASLVSEMTLPESVALRILEVEVKRQDCELINAILHHLSVDAFVGTCPESGSEALASCWERASCDHAQRKQIWQAWLSDSKKKIRTRGLDAIHKALERKDVDRATKDDAYTALTDYQAAQNQKKRPGTEASHLLPGLLEKCRPEDLAIEVEAATHRRFVYALNLIAERSGLERKLFEISGPTAPVDRNMTDADLQTPAARHCRLALHTAIQQLNSEALRELGERAEELPNAEFWNAWCDALPGNHHEPDGSHWQRAFATVGSWRIKYARWWNDLTQDEQKHLLQIALPQKEWKYCDDWIANRLAAHFHRRSRSTLRSEVIGEQMFGVMETLLARIPTRIQNAAFELPQHYSDTLLATAGIGFQLDGVEGILMSLPPNEAQSLRQRHANLMLWAHQNMKSGHYPLLDLAMPAAALGYFSIGDFLRFIIDNGDGWAGGGGKRLSLAMIQQQSTSWNLGIDPIRESQLKLAVETLESIIREQEEKLDPQLPEVFSIWFSKMPASQQDRDIASLLRRNAKVELTTRHKSESSEGLFIQRLEELESYDCLDALQQLMADGLLDEERALRLVLIQPGLVKSISALLNLPSLPDVLVWVWLHAGWSNSALNALAAAVGYTNENGSDDNSDGWLRLISTLAPEIECEHRWELDFPKMGTIRREWYERTLGQWETARRDKFIQTMQAVFPRELKTLLGILNALTGNLELDKLVAVIDRGRTCDELLYLALMPIAKDGSDRQADIANRLAVMERLAVSGKKLRTGDAKSRITAAIDQARRTLANNAGLADPTQLDWIAGEALQQEIQLLGRTAIDDCAMEIRVNGSGVQRLITKNGKPLKSIPASFKKAENAKRAMELQKRLETSFRLTRLSLEQSMLSVQVMDRNALGMAVRHPVVAAIFSELVFIEDDPSSKLPLTGRLDCATLSLWSVDEQSIPLPDKVRIAHPLDLDTHGVLKKWQHYFVERPPQTIAQLEREYYRLADIETASEGQLVLWPGMHKAVNIDQAFRVAQSQGWRDAQFRSGGLVRTFGSLMATCREWGNFVEFDGSLQTAIGGLSFASIDDPITNLELSQVPAIPLSEALRDLTRAQEAASLP